MRSGTVVLLVGLMAGCAKPPAPAPAAAAGGRGGGAPAPVKVAAVESKPMPVTVRAVGTAQAASVVDVRSQVTGQLLSVGFAEGADVTAGQVLFTLDARPFEAALAQAEAVLARDTAVVTNTQAQMQRADDLFTKGLVTKADRDALASTLAAQRATVAADAAAVANARLQVQYTKITAPVAGRTGALLMHPGALVRANDTTPLVTISQTAPLDVAFSIPARLLPRLRGAGGRPQGLRVDAKIPGGDGAMAGGRIAFVDSSVDTATDTIRVKATFENRDHALWPGQYVDVTLQLAVEPHALVVPTAALQNGQKGPFVYVAANGAAEVRPVEIAWTDGNVTVLTKGVIAGESVVVDGQLRITPGGKIAVR